VGQIYDNGELFHVDCLPRGVGTCDYHAAIGVVGVYEVLLAVVDYVRGRYLSVWGLKPGRMKKHGCE
jgi:hypothetical protein